VALGYHDRGREAKPGAGPSRSSAPGCTQAMLVCLPLGARPILDPGGLVDRLGCGAVARAAATLAPDGLFHGHDVLACLPTLLEVKACTSGRALVNAHEVTASPAPLRGDFPDPGWRSDEPAQSRDSLPTLLTERGCIQRTHKARILSSGPKRMGWLRWSRPTPIRVQPTRMSQPLRDRRKRSRRVFLYTFILTHLNDFPA
jgi:hypothetical protein